MEARFPLQLAHIPISIHSNINFSLNNVTVIKARAINYDQLCRTSETIIGAGVLNWIT